MTDLSSPAEQQPEPRHIPHTERRHASGSSDDLDALVSRLQVIDDQPLAQRAPAYVQLHDELRAALEGADASA